MVIDVEEIKFPHYKEAEMRIMKNFVKANYLIGQWTFDYRLPYPEELLPRGLVGPEKKMVIALKQKRIDAVCETRNEIWLLEVKYKLRPTAVGELLTYKNIYLKSIIPVKPVRLGVIAAHDDPLLHDVFKEHNIKIWIVPVV